MEDFKIIFPRGYIGLFNLIEAISPGRGTHIFGRMGMCRSKSSNMGPVFYQKILKHGSTFLTEPKYLGFCMAKTLKIAKFLKNGPIFQEKSLKMGTLFCQTHPYRWVGVLRLERHTPVQLKSEYPPAISVTFHAAILWVQSVFIVWSLQRNTKITMLGAHWHVVIYMWSLAHQFAEWYYPQDGRTTVSISLSLFTWNSFTLCTTSTTNGIWIPYWRVYWANLFWNHTSLMEDLPPNLLQGVCVLQME